MPIDPNTGLFVPGQASPFPSGGGTAALDILSNMLASQEAQRNQQSENLDLANKQNAYDDSMAYQQAVQGMPDTATSDDFFKAALRNTRDPQKAAQVIQAWDYHRQMADYHNSMVNVAGQNADTRAKGLDLRTYQAIAKQVDDNEKLGYDGPQIVNAVKAAYGSNLTPDMEASINQLVQSPEISSRIAARKSRADYLAKMVDVAQQRNQIMAKRAAAVKSGAQKPGTKFQAELKLNNALRSSELEIASLKKNQDDILATDPRKQAIQAQLDAAIERQKQLQAKWDAVEALPDDPASFNDVQGGRPATGNPAPSSVSTATMKSGATKRFDPATGELVDIP